MKELNKFRLLAGIPIDHSIEKTVVTEAREMPDHRHELAPTNEKTLGARVAGTQSAIKHLTNAIKALEKIPATNFHGDIQHFIKELDYVLKGDGTSPGGLQEILSTFKKEQRSHVRSENARVRQEEEEAAALEELSAKEADDDTADESPEKSDEETDQEDADVDAEEGAKEEDQASEYEEEMAAAKDYDKDGEVESQEDEHKGVVDKAIKKAKAESVKESGDFYYDNKTEQVPGNDGKDESPSQLDDGLGDPSDSETKDKIKVPNEVKKALRDEIDQARKEAKKMGSTNGESKRFYEDLANAFEELLGHIEKGTVTDMKKAQLFWSSLMSPMLHKVPTVVSRFIVNGGQKRSLKSFMQEVK